MHCSLASSARVVIAPLASQVLERIRAFVVDQLILFATTTSPYTVRLGTPTEMGVFIWFGAGTRIFLLRSVMGTLRTLKRILELPGMKHREEVHRVLLVVPEDHSESAHAEDHWRRGCSSSWLRCLV